jgi:hypothetical protein
MPWGTDYNPLTGGIDSPASGPDQFLPGLFEEPPGTLARTFPRSSAGGASSALTSGTIYQRLIVLPAGIPCTNVIMDVGTTAKTGGTHGWYCLADVANKVLVTSADQLDAATTWGSISAEQPLPLLVDPATGKPFITKYTGVYYVGIMVAAAVTPLILFGGFPSSPIAALAPVLCGSSLTAQTTPPAPGTALGAITASGGYNFYARIS